MQDGGRGCRGVNREVGRPVSREVQDGGDAGVLTGERGGLDVKLTGGR